MFNSIQKYNCRDTDGDGFLWCYTTLTETRWTKCDVPLCPGKVFCSVDIATKNIQIMLVCAVYNI